MWTALTQLSVACSQEEEDGLPLLKLRCNGRRNRVVLCVQLRGAISGAQPALVQLLHPGFVARGLDRGLKTIFGHTIGVQHAYRGGWGKTKEGTSHSSQGGIGTTRSDPGSKLPYLVVRLLDALNVVGARHPNLGLELPTAVVAALE